MPPYAVRRLYLRTAASPNTLLPVCSLQAPPGWRDLLRCAISSPFATCQCQSRPCRKTITGRTFSSVVIFFPLSKAADITSRDCLGFRLTGGLLFIMVLGEEAASEPAWLVWGAVDPDGSMVDLGEIVEAVSPLPEGAGDDSLSAPFNAASRAK